MTEYDQMLPRYPEVTGSNPVPDTFFLAEISGPIQLKTLDNG
jgi:hypothetical protein